MSLTKIYFPNLNGLRFIAAFMVIVYHIEQFLSYFGYENLTRNPVIKLIGPLGVELFFVLSGFLITYLILAEEKVTKTISIKDFYIRRILRIWPLYYFVGFLAFFVLPHLAIFNIPIYSDIFLGNFDISLLLYLLFLPNVILFGNGILVPYASQSWSVGVEEQFYLIWPIIMKYSKNKLVVLFSIIIIYLFVRVYGFSLIKNYLFWNDEMNAIQKVWEAFKIHCMAIGALFSYALFHKKKILTLLLDKRVYFSSVIVLIGAIGFSIKISFLYDVLFGLIILNLASSEKKGVFLENGIMNFLGKISYGLYMYHVIAIVLCIKIFEQMGWINNYILLLTVTTLTTILLATFSYYLIEKKFILLKNRFSKVISGENAK